MWQKDKFLTRPSYLVGNVALLIWALSFSGTLSAGMPAVRAVNPAAVNLAAVNPAAVGLGGRGGVRGKDDRDEECETLFAELRETYEGLEEVGDKAQALLRFSKAPCDKTVKFLRRLFNSEQNPGLHMAANQTLGKIRSAAAMEVLVTVGAPALAKDAFAFESVRKAIESNRWDDDAESWFLKRGMKMPVLRKYPEEWVKILRAVGRFSSSDRNKALIGELSNRSNSVDVLAALLEMLENVKSSKVASAAKRALRAKDARVQAGALYCLHAQGGKKYARNFTRALKSKEPLVRMVGLHLLAEIKDKKVVEYATVALEDKDLKVQIAAVRALLTKGGQSVIEPLIKALETADGRLKDDLTDALARLSGRDLGTFSVQWESWWKQNKNKAGDFKPMSAEKFSEMLGEKKNVRTLMYHGLRVISHYVTFIVDTSESMKETYVPREEREKNGEGKAGEDGEGGRTVVDTPEDGAKGKKGKKGKKKKEHEQQRIEIAKKELAQVLKNLDEGHSFNVIGFDSVIRDYIQDTLGKQPLRLEKMNEETRKSAYGFVDQTKAAGRTYMLKALKNAFAYDDLDTIFLLSDGAPTPASGTMVMILEYVRRENRLRKVRINAIGFDLEEKEKQFLLRLTDENFGVFVER